MKLGFKGMLLLRQPATAKEIAVQMQPALDADQQGVIAEAIQSNLDRVYTTLPLASVFLRKVEDRYDLPDSVYAYAFELALGMA